MSIPIILLEGILLCFFLWLICYLGTRGGAVGMVHLYGKDVQERAVELKLTTKEKIKKASIRFKTIGLLLYFGYIIIAVYFVNGARGFMQGFLQSLIIIMMMGVFDRVVVDFFWVGHTKHWIIPGTEDLQPYISVKEHLMKWAVTIIVYPAIVALIALVMSAMQRGSL